MVFEKTLTDIVKGIRASKRDTALYISSCIAEIKSEINSTDPHTKANALQKLTFLQMMGYNMSWASFATIEVMSSPRFAHKRIGYLAASQAFTQDTDVILLTTNTLKKELRGAVGPGMNGVYEAGVAINCLSNIVTEDLARELLSDVTNLTLHPQPYLRKKAILCLLKMFMKYPQALRLTFPRIQECLLKDSNSSVTSCAVNVITELSDVNPKNYLILAPAFFGLLTSSSNNWMLIKVVKLLGTLVPEEPRLARKLLEPLAGIVKSTQAKSLLYEAAYTITLCLPYCRKADGTMPASVPSIVALSAETLKSFVEENDQNLKYLGLVGFGSLMTSHPKVLSAPGYRPLILACLSDEDVTIRTRALDLLIGLATRKNVMDLVTQLLHHVDMASGAYKIDLVEKIVEICSSEKYSLVTDFAWYIDVLVILARTKGIDGHGKNSRNLGPLVSNQIIDVTLRVLPVRSYAVRRMIGLMLDGGMYKDKGIFSGTFGLESNVSMMPEVLPVAAFIIGEYSSLIDEAISLEIEGGEDEDELLKYNASSKGTYHAIIQAETDPSNIDSLCLQTQSVYAQATMKVFASATYSKKCTDSELEACAKTLTKYLPVYMQSMDAEVQERSFTAFQLLNTLGLIDNPTAPSLQRIDDDESDEDVGKGGTHNLTDDLLNLGIGSGKDIKPPPVSNAQSLSDFPMSSSTTGTLASKARAVSETLKYLLIPEHMKPISSKAQRKKKASAPEHIKAILDNENPAIFTKLFNEASLRRGRLPNSIESVSFSSQQKARSSSIGVTSISNSTLPSKTRDDPFLMVHNGSNANITPQNATNDPTTSLTAKQHDPFYLNSESKGDAEESKANRFGAIQLMDSDDNCSDSAKKKKRKKKNKKAKASGDLEFLSSMGSMTNDDHGANLNVSLVRQSIIDSDDDDESNEPALAIARQHNNQGSSSKWNSLANIDLTTPLREDEFIPEPKHHVVADRLFIPAVEEPLRSSKKKKKEKKSKISKTSKAGNEQENPTSDLLDFGGFAASSSTGVFSSDTAQPSNAINDAFDDLLSLNAPSPLPVPIVPVLSEIIPTPTKNGTNSAKTLRFWQKASLKNTLAATSFHWDDVQIMYKTYSPKKNFVKLSIKVCNKSSVNALPNVVITLPGVDALRLEQVDPQAEMDMGKVGPFSMSSLDLKGSISIGQHTAHIKVNIPSSKNMSPICLSQDDMSVMLNSDEWVSYTSKVEVHSQIDLGTLKVSLMEFLSASEIGDGMDNSNYILSSKTSDGTIALLLIKATERGLKIDVKSKDKKTAKALSSDLKKVLM